MMNRLPFFLLTSLLVILASAKADLTVVQKIEGMGDMATESTTKIKGDKMRVDVMKGMSMILDSNTGDILNLMHAQKSYMKVPAELAKQAIASMSAQAPAADAKPKLTATGKKDTINKYPCEEYTTEVAGRKVSLWLTTALPDYKAALKQLSESMNKGPLAATMQSFNVYTTDMPGFPIRTSSEIAPGQTVTATTVSIDQKPVLDADFAVPAGYKELSMPMLTPPAAAPAPTAK